MTDWGLFIVVAFLVCMAVAIVSERIGYRRGVRECLHRQAMRSARVAEMLAANESRRGTHP